MAVDIAIDTNRYRDFVDGVPEVVAVFRMSPRIFVPFVVVGELRAGFAVGSRGMENERVFEQFLHRSRVQVLLPTIETTRHLLSYRDSATRCKPVGRVRCRTAVLPKVKLVPETRIERAQALRPGRF